MNNAFIKAQCTNMDAMLDNFLSSVKLAATRDDGKISKDEARAIRRIEKSVLRLRKVIGKYL